MNQTNNIKAMESFMDIKYNYLPKEFSDPDQIFSNWRKLVNSTEFTLGTFVLEFELRIDVFMFTSSDEGIFIKR